MIFHDFLIHMGTAKMALFMFRGWLLKLRPIIENFWCVILKPAYQGSNWWYYYHFNLNQYFIVYIQKKTQILPSGPVQKKILTKVVIS